MSTSAQELQVLSIHIGNENLLGSWFRNTIILFSFAITISTFSRNKYKDHVAILLYFMGITIGVISLYNYLTIYQNIKNQKFDIVSEYTYNLYTMIAVLVVLTMLFIAKFKNKILKYIY